jgi:hypothetical protein
MSKASTIYTNNVRETRRHFAALEEELLRDWARSDMGGVEYERRRDALRAEMAQCIEQERAVYWLNAAEERGGVLREFSVAEIRALLARGVVVMSSVGVSGYSVWDNGCDRVLTLDEIRARAG